MAIYTIDSWQAHTVRGFVSGAVGKQLSLTVDAAKRKDGERCCRVRG